MFASYCFLISLKPPKIYQDLIISHPTRGKWLNAEAGPVTETYWFHLKADRILEDDERLKKRSCCCGCLSGLEEIMERYGKPMTWQNF